MKPLIGVGYSEAQSAEVAVREALTMAFERAGTSNVNFALVFSTSAYDDNAIHKQLLAILPTDCKISGGHAVGIISNEFLAYDGFQLGVLLAKFDENTIEIFHDGSLNKDGVPIVGRRLGKKISEMPRTPDAMLLLYDSVDCSQGYFQFNMATPLLEGMSAKIKKWPNVAGCGLSGDMKGSPGHQWVNDKVLDQQAMAILFSGLEMHTTVLHGCKPNGLYHTVTKSKGAEVLEIDGKPALDLIAELLGHEVEKHWKEYGFFITLGMNRGEKYGEFKEEDYINRLCLRVNKDNRSLVLFEPDVTEGTEIQLMRRSLDLEYVHERIWALKNEIGDKEILFALYIDCAGRASAFSGMDEEEAYAVMKALGPDIPLLGWYSGVELATIQNEVRALDWTGVLCMFTQKA